MARIEFEWFDIDVPPEWGEVETRDTYDGPVLAGRDRSGWLLFQVTPYEPDGPSLGELSAEQLLDMVMTFGETRFWGLPTDVIAEPGPPRLAAGTFTTDDGAFVRVWHVMDGLDYACIFYRCDSGAPGDDVPLCERVVRSIVIHPA